MEEVFLELEGISCLCFLEWLESIGIDGSMDIWSGSKEKKKRRFLKVFTLFLPHTPAPHISHLLCSLRVSVGEKAEGRRERYGRKVNRLVDWRGRGW